MRLVVTGGGTGGHVYPAVALAEYLQVMSGADVLFIGSKAGPEGGVARDAGINFKGLKLAGLVGKSPARAVKAAFLFLEATLHCRAFFKDWRPDCVVGSGGYASAPACAAAALLGIPFILHEMNYEPGLVTRLLCRRAASVALAFEGTATLLKRAARLDVTGVPVRAEIEGLSDPGSRLKARAEGIRRFGLEEGRRTLLVFGGSQGAQVINRSVWEALPRAAHRSDIQVLHLTGRKGLEDPGMSLAEEMIAGSELLYRPLGYLEEMQLAYACADLALSRAGAGTVAELTASGVPSVLVPFPHAGGHQEMNARGLAELGSAVVVLQQGDSAADAVTEALDILGDGGKLASMQAATKVSAASRGTEGIAALVEELT